MKVIDAPETGAPGKARQGAPPIAKKIQHPDAGILDLIASWRLARASAEVAWAASDKRTLFGMEDDGKGTRPWLEYLEQMRNMEDALANWKARTLYGTRQHLLVALEILAKGQADPHHVLACGPVLEIVCAVAETLNCQGASDFILKGEEEAIAPREWEKIKDWEEAQRKAAA